MLEVQRLTEIHIEEIPGSDELDAAALPPDLAQTVERLWREELAVRRDALHDGRIFSVRELAGPRLRGTFVPYRAWIAQRREPSLAPRLKIRPLAVSGILCVEGGIVFGERGPQVTQAPGCWEFVPSGGLEPGARRAGELDASAQLRIELAEELGLQGQVVARERLLGYVADSASGVIDLVFALDLSITRSELLARFGERGPGEYAQLRIVDTRDVDAYLATAAQHLVPTCAAQWALMTGRP